MRLHILGSINLDVILQVEALPRPGETILALGATTGQGGKGANQAVAAARYGGEIHLHGAVGSDEDGRRLLNDLKTAGVDVQAVLQSQGAATGRAYIMVSADGENMIVVHAGANGLAQFLPPEPTETAAVYLAQLETQADAVRAMFEMAGPEAIRILNAAPATADGKALLSLAEVIVVNETELGFYTGSPDVTPEAAEAGARSLISRENQTVIVTLGSLGALLVRESEVVTLPPRPAKVVDTTGAGDCFVGVLAAVLAGGGRLDHAAHLANLAASLSVQKLGADSAPSRDELDRQWASSGGDAAASEQGRSE